jgi:hypothetical protein
VGQADAAADQKSRAGLVAQPGGRRPVPGHMPVAGRATLLPMREHFCRRSQSTASPAGRAHRRGAAPYRDMPMRCGTGAPRQHRELASLDDHPPTAHDLDGHRMADDWTLVMRPGPRGDCPRSSAACSAGQVGAMQLPPAP